MLSKCICLCWGLTSQSTIFQSCRDGIKVYRQWVKCIDSGYLVGATPLTFFHRLFWNFADAFCMGWRCACGLGIILWLFYLFCFVNFVFFWYEILSQCIDSGYLVGTTPLPVFNRLFWNFADIFCMEWRCACGFGVILFFSSPEPKAHKVSL